MKRLLALLACLCALAAAGCAGFPAANSPASGGTLPQADAQQAAMLTASDRYIVLAVANNPGRLNSRAGSSLLGYSSPPRYVVGSRAAAVIAALLREYPLRETASWPIPQLSLHCVVLELAPGASRDTVLAALARDERVQVAQPLQEFQVHGDDNSGDPRGEGVRYNDPYVKLQHGFAETGAARAHLSSLGTGVHIAVVDTGADTGHPDLQGRIRAAHNFVDGDAAAFNQDRHGTEVAGVIAAVGNNAQGIVGMAPGARLSLFKACWQTPARPEAGARCNSFTLAKALAAVIDSSAEIVNLSLGGPADSLLDKLLAVLLKQGRIVVAALPPDGRRGGFPTGTPGVIAVGMDAAEPAAQGVITAPGRDVLTLRPGARYDFAQGSSIAAAHVSGVMALLLAMPSRLEPQALAELLRSGGRQHADQPSQLSADGALDALSARQRRSAQR
jgi:subtilisin family serine protease